MTNLRQTGPGTLDRLELELLWASTSGTRTELASDLLLNLDTLADLLGLHMVLQAWSYVWRSCPHQEGSARWSYRSAWLQRRYGRSRVLLPRCASQFDPAIDKERKLISNLTRNMPVLLDSPECAGSESQYERRSTK